MKFSTKSPERLHFGMAKLIAVIGASIMSIALFAGIFAWTMSGTTISPEARLNAGLRLLKKGESREALLRAVTIDEKTLESPADKSKYQLILGAAALDDAVHIDARHLAIKKAEDSKEHLKEASKIGFPRGYEGLGNFLLGKALFMLYLWDEAIQPLEIAVAEWPSGRTESMERLVDIELGSEKPNVELLRKRLEQWDGLAGLTETERDLAQVKRIEMELAAGENEVAKKLAANFSNESRYADKAKYLLALIELKNSPPSAPDQQNNDLARILKEMQEVARSPSIDKETRRRSKFYGGLIQRKMNRLQSALTAFSSLRQEAPQTVECVAAAIEEIQILIDLTRYVEASKTMKQLADQFGKVAWYQNRWVPIEQMRQRTNELGQSLIKAKAFPETISFAEHLPPFCERSDALKLLAESYRQWAFSLSSDRFGEEPLLDIRKAMSTESKSPYEKQQHELFSNAAKSFKELATLELRSPDYHRLIWAAIDCSQAAGELSQSNTMISNAMAYEPRDRQPRSILKMAENYFAMQELDKSLTQLERCVTQHPQHPLAYQARLNMARILSEQSNFDRAVDFLEENLYVSELSPQSPIWRESLFELGKLYFRHGEEQHALAESLKDQTTSAQKLKRHENLEASNAMFLKSIDHLEKWIKRYPLDSRRFDTLYAIGQAYQMAAQWNAVQLDEKLLVSDDQIRTRQLELRKLLDSARRTYKDIRDGINASKDWAVLDSAQQRILRNSYFAEADLMYQTKKYDEALAAYRNIANRLLNEPESLEALTQAAECLKKLGRHEESHRVVDQARSVLEQIPSQRDPQFVSFTRFSRSEWSKHLDWMGRNTR